MAKATLILGTGTLAQQVAVGLGSHRVRGYRLLGEIGEGPRAGSEDLAGPLLGTTFDLPRVVAERRIRRLIVAPADPAAPLPLDLLIGTRTGRRLSIESGGEVLEKLTGRIAIASMPQTAVLASLLQRPRRSSLLFSRMMSVAIALAALAVLAPLMALIALAIRIDSRGPILFVQERIGRDTRRFKFLKFRSMFHSTPRRSEWACDNSAEITRVGRFIRRFRLDELPQFLNVLLGDMNIVGPRPHPASNRELLVLVARNASGGGDPTPYYSLRQSVLPGITGWAQVRYKYANGLDEEIEKLCYDLYYVKHCSPLLDLRILFETVKVVLRGGADAAGASGASGAPSPAVVPTAAEEETSFRSSPRPMDARRRQGAEFRLCEVESDDAGRPDRERDGEARAGSAPGN